MAFFSYCTDFWKTANFSHIVKNVHPLEPSSSIVLVIFQTKTMSFHRIYNEIREKIGDNAKNLYNRELIQKIFMYSKDVNWNFNEDYAKKAKITFEMASAEKDRGTTFFRKNQLQEACETYTNFLKMTHTIPDDSADEKTKLIFQGYANRSAVLFRANRYLACLDDISAALHYSPNPKADYMIHDRRARCCLFLQQWTQARKAFAAALTGVDMVDSLKDEIKQAFRAQVETHLAKIPTDEMIKEVGDEVMDEDFIMDDSDFLIKLKKAHEFHPGLTDKILVRYTESKGRYTIAKEDIKAGEVVAVEDANVSFTHYDPNSNESKACHHCVGVLKVNKHPSPVIDGIYFCCFVCMNTAMKSYHKHEAEILKDYIEKLKVDENIERSGCLFLALKAIAKKPWPFYCDNKRSEMFIRTNPSFGINENDDKLDFAENKIIHLYNLVNHEDKITEEERIRTAIRTIILLQSLKQTGYFEGLTFSKDEFIEEELIIGVLLYKLQLGITYNVHLIYRLNGEMSEGIPLDMTGSAVYHQCVLLNHSCAANTARFFQVRLSTA